MYDESLSVLLRMEKYFIKSGKEIFFPRHRSGGGCGKGELKLKQLRAENVEEELLRRRILLTSRKCLLIVRLIYK